LSLAWHFLCRWVHCLEEEFYRQGDCEKKASLPISPLFDRTKPGVTKSQIGFFDVVALPLYQVRMGTESLIYVCCDQSISYSFF
jgi:hypothetical protein